MKVTLVGTANLVNADIAEELAKRSVDTPYSFISHPEFLNEGVAVEDLIRPDRIVAGADVGMVRQGIGSDPRIGYDFLYPGCGYGGTCFSKDVKALIKTAADKAKDALDAADALIIVTEWQEFRSADLDTIKRSLKTPTIFDGRNLYDPKFVREQGIGYFPVGR
jgi:UDP-glucose 6-dehydrogenase